MIIFRKCYGFSASGGCITSVTVWDNVFSSTYPMMFYKGDVGDLIEISKESDKKDIIISHFTFTSSDIYDLNLRERELISLYDRLKKLNPHRLSFSIDKRTMLEVKEEDFDIYTCPHSGEYVAFILNAEKKEGGFPAIYVVSRPASSSLYRDALPVLAYSSHVVPTSMSQTETGKELTYILLNSLLHGKFMKECPNLNNMVLPENSMLNIPAYYRIKELENFSKKCGALNILQTVEGQIVKDAGDLPAQSSPEVKFESAKEDIRSRIHRQLLDKNSINLSDILMMGIKETMDIVAHKKNIIITVELDVANVARKMCLLEGFIYVIPDGKSQDWESFCGDAGYFVECSEEGFPKYQLEGGSKWQKAS